MPSRKTKTGGKAKTGTFSDANGQQEMKIQETQNQVTTEEDQPKEPRFWTPTGIEIRVNMKTELQSYDGRPKSEPHKARSTVRRLSTPTRQQRELARLMLTVWGEQIQARELPNVTPKPRFMGTAKEALQERWGSVGHAGPAIDTEWSGYVGHVDSGSFRPGDDPHPAAFCYLTVEKLLSDLGEPSHWAYIQDPETKAWIWREVQAPNVYRDLSRWLYVELRSVGSFRGHGGQPMAAQSLQGDLVGELSMRIGHSPFRSVIDALVEEARLCAADRKREMGRQRAQAFRNRSKAAEEEVSKIA